jgi:hypothetical protein
MMGRGRRLPPIGVIVDAGLALRLAGAVLGWQLAERPQITGQRSHLTPGTLTQDWPHEYDSPAGCAPLLGF